MTNDDKDLKPCPFCGDTKYLRVTYQDSKANASITGDKKYWGVFCMEKCGASIDSIYPTREEAIRVWNTRATPQQPSEPLKALDECSLRSAIIDFFEEWEAPLQSVYSKDMAKYLCSKFGQPTEKKALSRDGITDIIRIDLRDKMKKGKLGLVGYTRTELAEELSQAIHSALPARKEVKWPEKMDEERFYCEDGDIYRGREWNECRDACIAAYEEAIPAHQYIEYLKSENESLRKFPPCGTAQREVRYPEKDYCGKRKTALHKDNCEECKYHKLRNKLIDEFKKLNS